MIDWDSIEDGQIEITGFEQEFGRMNYMISIKYLDIEIPVHDVFMADDDEKFEYYLHNGKEVDLTHSEVNNEFFTTLKERIFRLFPELLL